MYNPKSTPIPTEKVPRAHGEGHAADAEGSLDGGLHNRGSRREDPSLWQE